MIDFVRLTIFSIGWLLSLFAVLGVSAQTGRIRDVDFPNFRYKGPKDYPVTFVLRKGGKPYVHGKDDGIVLTGVAYHDLTGDGQDEAIVRMSLQTGGSAIPELVFIYSFRTGKPIVLWSFISGDRADGGLRNIAVQDGDLLLEFGGDVKFANARFESRPVGDAACCPSRYSRIKLRWDGRQFAQIGVTQVSRAN